MGQFDKNKIRWQRGDLPNLRMVTKRQQLVVNLGIQRAANAIVDNGHVLEVKGCTVVFVVANLAMEFSGAVGFVEVPELVWRQSEAVIAEKVAVVFAELYEIVEQGYMTAAVRAWGILFVIRIALSAFLIRTALSAFVSHDALASCCCLAKKKI